MSHFPSISCTPDVLFSSAPLDPPPACPFPHLSIEHVSLQKIVRSREEGARVQGCSIFVSGAEGDQEGRPHRQALGPPRPRRCRRCCCPPCTIPGRSSVRGGAQHSHHQRILLSVTNCSASFLPRTPWYEFWRGRIGIPISRLKVILRRVMGSDGLKYAPVGCQAMKTRPAQGPRLVYYSSRFSPAVLGCRSRVFGCRMMRWPKGVRGDYYFCTVSAAAADSERRLVQGAGAAAILGSCNRAHPRQLCPDTIH